MGGNSSKDSTEVAYWQKTNAEGEQVRQALNKRIRNDRQQEQVAEQQEQAAQQAAQQAADKQAANIKRKEEDIKNLAYVLMKNIIQNKYLEGITLTRAETVQYTRLKTMLSQQGGKRRTKRRTRRA